MLLKAYNFTSGTRGRPGVCSSGHNKTRALSWQRVHSCVGDKLGRRLKGFIDNKNVCVCVCATTTSMQLLPPVSAVVTIEMGSRLTTSCHCLATVLSRLNRHPLPVWCLLCASAPHVRHALFHIPQCSETLMARAARGGQ